MDKPYKISYKTYFNEKLKKVQFGKTDTHPLYVQVSYERKTIFFKSNFFELFSKTKYVLDVAGIIESPSIEKIVELESEVIEYIILKHSVSFTLDIFKKEYAYYSQDICDLMEEGFRDYLYTFFEDKGMPAFAVVLREGSNKRIAYDIIRDLKKGLAENFYSELITNSLYYGPPYLPLYDFVYHTKDWPMLFLSVMEWESNIKSQFKEYLKTHYNSKNAEDIIFKIEACIENFKI